MSPDLSVVIPLYNEEPNVAELHRELTAALGAWGRSYELLCSSMTAARTEPSRHCGRCRAATRTCG